MACSKACFPIKAALLPHRLLYAQRASRLRSQSRGSTQRAITRDEKSSVRSGKPHSYLGMLPLRPRSLIQSPIGGQPIRSQSRSSGTEYLGGPKSNRIGWGILPLLCRYWTCGSRTPKNSAKSFLPISQSPHESSQDIEGRMTEVIGMWRAIFSLLKQTLACVAALMGCGGGGL